jgi:hypothetical protein
MNQIKLIKVGNNYNLLVPNNSLYLKIDEDSYDQVIVKSVEITSECCKVNIFNYADQKLNELGEVDSNDLYYADSKIPYIYRDISLKPTKEASAKFLQAISISKATITSCFSLRNGFPDSSANRHEIFFRLRFLFQENLDKFHSLGFKTTKPVRVRIE